MTPPYVIDSDVFMQAKNLHYGFDFCPAFWDWLITANAQQRVFSIERVGKEIAAGADELSTWAAQLGEGFFLKPDDKLQTALGRVSAWANSQSYDPAAVSTFMAAADYYLVAHALASGHVVVSHEKFEPYAKKRIMIPNACKGLGVACVTPFAMLRDEKASFVLGPMR